MLYKGANTQELNQNMKNSIKNKVIYQPQVPSKQFKESIAEKQQLRSQANKDLSTLGTLQTKEDEI